MTQPASDEEMQIWESQHSRIDRESTQWCSRCLMHWPCHTAKLLARLKASEAALHAIADHEHCIYQGGENSYNMGVVDGHRCAAKVAKGALEPPGEG